MRLAADSGNRIALDDAIKPFGVPPAFIRFRRVFQFTSKRMLGSGLRRVPSLDPLLNKQKNIRSDDQTAEPMTIQEIKRNIVYLS